MQDPKNRATMNWKNQKFWPGPDYLSSSRKRLAPQLIFKGGILNAWHKRSAVALDAGFFATLPTLKEVAKEKAEIAWLIYDLELNKTDNLYVLTKKKSVYTKFAASLEQITKSEPGDINGFISVLQEKLDEKLNGTPPDNQTIDQIL
jgi:hypothetical protein